MRTLGGLAAFLQIGLAHAESVERLRSETDEMFMTRVLGPSMELAQKVVRSTEIANGRLTLIGFAPTEEDASLVGHLLIETSPGHFEHVTFPSCDADESAPDLLAVFFARIAKNGGRDLGVLCRWDIRHAVTQGVCFSALFFQVTVRETKTVVVPATELNKKFEDSCDLDQTDKRGKWFHGSKPTFKTVRDVKKLLTKMGLAQ